ncbi:DUF1653 domain-containing protein [Caldimonas mangrovi]|uniref:DUF1653 domain-containing protein n=1 Tax=Caldimonas mangrovi TaxID=2944811 RepID=UPI0034A3CBE2
MSRHPPTKPLPQQPLGRFRHYSGSEYEVLCMARHSETEEPLVIYRQLDQDTGFWARPHAMFFSEVEHDGKVQPRFAMVTEMPSRFEPVAGASPGQETEAAAIGGANGNDR